MSSIQAPPADVCYPFHQSSLQILSFLESLFPSLLAHNRVKTVHYCSSNRYCLCLYVAPVCMCVCCFFLFFCFFVFFCFFWGGGGGGGEGQVLGNF